MKIDDSLYMKTLWDLMLSPSDFQPTKKDDSSLHRFNRVFQENPNFKKRINMENVPFLNQENCSISLVSWSMFLLSSLIMAHNKKLSSSEHMPVSVVKINDDYFVVGGNSRINKWISEKQDCYHCVILVELKESVGIS